MKKNLKLMIIGHARAGKDTVAEIISEVFGLSFESSSLFMIKLIAFDLMKDKYKYNTPEELFENRHKHRVELFDIIRGFDEVSNLSVSELIFKDYDIYVGCRNSQEVKNAVFDGLVDFVIWVNDDAIDGEPGSSDVYPELADYVIDNTLKNKTILFYEIMSVMGDIILKKYPELVES